MKWVWRHRGDLLLLAVLFAVLCIAVAYMAWQPVQASDAQAWDLNTIVAIHSLVDWQSRATEDVWLDPYDAMPCKQGEYGLWCNFKDAVTNERVWFGPWIRDLSEVIVVDSFCAQNHTSVTYEIVVMFHDGIEWANLANEVFVPRYKWVCIDHPIPLRAGYRFGAWFRGATSTDDLKVNILWHTIMKEQNGIYRRE